MAQDKRYDIAKMDLDVQVPQEWLDAWIESRKTIIYSLGLDCPKVRMHPTEHGLHFWFYLDPPVDFERLMKIQFLLGDDHPRVYFGQQRMGFKRFRDKFNILFSKKRKVEK